jgi:excisionase family DNA binding protein
LEVGNWKLEDAGDTMAENLKASELITLKEAAEYSELSYAYLRQIARSGRLKAQKFGNVWLTTRAHVDEYIRTRKKTGFYREDIGKA